MILLVSWEGLSNPSLFYSLLTRFSGFGVEIRMEVDHSVLVPPYAVSHSKSDDCGNVPLSDLVLSRGTLVTPSVLSSPPGVLSSLRHSLLARSVSRRSGGDEGVGGNQSNPLISVEELSVSRSYEASPLVSGSDEERFSRVLRGKGRMSRLKGGTFLSGEDVLITK